MTLEANEQNPSEPATPFKLSRARGRGVVARGLDLGFAAGLIALFVCLWLLGPRLAAAVLSAAARAFSGAPTVAIGQNALIGAAVLTCGPLLRLILGVMIAVVLLVAVLEFLQTGPVFSFEPLKFDLGRLNPATGFKRVFSPRLLAETAKSLLKLLIYVLIAAWIGRLMLSSDGPAMVDALRTADGLAMAALRLIAAFAIAAILFAAVDQMIARGFFQRRMRMSRRELRREVRDREGDPRIKQRRKQLHRQFAKLSQSLRNVKGADVLITNPTHFAVALRYDPKTMTAPAVVAQASNQFALRLRRLAFVYGVVIVQNERLARNLFYRAELNKPVPELYYHAVADIYLGLRARERARSAAASHA